MTNDTKQRGILKSLSVPMLVSTLALAMCVIGHLTMSHAQSGYDDNGGGGGPPPPPPPQCAAQMTSVQPVTGWNCGCYPTGACVSGGFLGIVNYTCAGSCTWPETCGSTSTSYTNVIVEIQANCVAPCSAPANGQPSDAACQVVNVQPAQYDNIMGCACQL
jgi:hypothetical protein